MRGINVMKDKVSLLEGTRAVFGQKRADVVAALVDEHGDFFGSSLLGK
jgi:hypothetical protein